MAAPLWILGTSDSWTMCYWQKCTCGPFYSFFSIFFAPSVSFLGACVLVTRANFHLTPSFWTLEKAVVQVKHLAFRWNIMCWPGIEHTTLTRFKSQLLPHYALRNKYWVVSLYWNNFTFSLGVTWGLECHWDTVKCTAHILVWSKFSHKVCKTIL